MLTLKQLYHDFKGMNSQKSTYFVLLLITLYYTALMILQKGLVDTTDGLSHYQLAKYAFDYPENFFNLWGRPLFTLFAAIPAQFGWVGVKILNLVFILLSAKLLISTAANFQIEKPYLAGVFVAFGNEISHVILGGLTEPLFVLLFSAILFFISVDKWNWGFLLAGASILVRPESIVLVAGLTIASITHKRWKGTPLVLLFPMVYTLLGYVTMDFEITWLITGQSHQSLDSIYGSGEWFHFMEFWKRIVPFTILGLSLLSLIFWKRERFPLQLISAFTGFGIIILHSILWAKGWMGSAGLLRTIVTAVPGLAILATIAISRLYQYWKWSIFLIIPFYGIEVFSHNTYPEDKSSREKAAEMMASSLSNKIQVKDKHIAYQYALVGYFLELNPFDRNQTSRLWSLNPSKPSDRLRVGDILIWDNITGHREGRIRFEAVNQDPHLRRMDSVNVDQFSLVSFEVVN